MPPTVDFTSWLTPSLVIPLGGRTYTVPPPSVAAARNILACAVRSELSLGLVTGTLDDELTAVLADLADVPLGDITLTVDVHAQMVADGLPASDIDRAAYYALHFWARGKERADWLAEHLWGDAAGGEGAAPKGRSRSRSGRRTGSASPTRTASTRTTGSPSS